MTGRPRVRTAVAWFVAAGVLLCAGWALVLTGAIDDSPARILAGVALVAAAIRTQWRGMNRREQDR